MKTTLLLTFFGACLAASAGSVCPAATGANPFPHPPDPTGTGCNVVITIAANGAASTQLIDTTGYEDSEDVLVGVVNNSGTSVTQLSLTGTAIFGFDADGICIYTFVGSSYCTTSQIQGNDPGDYQGPTSTFAITNANSGSVNFSPAIAAHGGTTYFSLEGTPTASLQITVTGGPTPTPTTATAPTLGEWGMILLGVLLIGSAAILTGRKSNQTV